MLGNMLSESDYIGGKKKKPCKPLPAEAQSQWGSEGRYHCRRWSVLPRRESKNTVP